MKPAPMQHVQYSLFLPLLLIRCVCLKMGSANATIHAPSGKATAMETTTVGVSWSTEGSSMVLFHSVSLLTPTTHDLDLNHRESVSIVMECASGLVISSQPL